MPLRSAEIGEFRTALFRWYARHQRELPWRRTEDPYAIWVSEVMLQQTQVKTVISYWRRFLERFPDVRALASASLPDVLAEWSGLGYYSRARGLHRAAQIIAAEHAGKLPRTAEGLKNLPGFGRYTAGAVASIAFGECAPAVDGNLARVLSRVFLIDGCPGNPGRERKIWALADRIVQGDRPGDLNQALMELGAVVCRSHRPDCLLCPIRSRCKALQRGRVGQIPSPRPRPVRTRLRFAVAVWRRKGRFLVARRPDEGLFGGLWELPSAVLTSDVGLTAIESALRGLLGASLRCHGLLQDIRRTLTHRELQLFPVLVSGSSKPDSIRGYQEIRWVEEPKLMNLAMSSGMAQVIRACAAGSANRAA